MAKKKTVKRRSRVSRFKSSVRRGTRKVASNNLVRAGAAMAYGASREKINGLISPWVSKVPVLGDLTDEAALGLAAMYLKKKVKNKMLKSYLDAVMIVESSSAGFQLMKRGKNAAASTGTSSSGGYQA